MSACPHRISHIHQLLDGELSPEEEAELKEHLGKCQGCAEEMIRLKKSAGILEEWLSANTVLLDDDFVIARASFASTRFPAVEDASDASTRIPAAARATKPNAGVRLKKAVPRFLKKLALASAAAVVVVVAAALIFGHFYFRKTFSYDLKQVVLRCTDGIEISDDGTDWRPLCAGNRLAKATNIKTPAGEQSFVSFDGIRLLTDDKTEFEMAGRRALTLDSGEMYVESAQKKREPVSIAMGKASVLSNGDVLRIAQNEEGYSIGVASGVADLTMPDGTTHSLAEGYAATWKEDGSELALMKGEVIDPFARMRITATERTKQRFKQVISKYFPDWQMTGYSKDGPQNRGMVDMLSEPEGMYRFASYAPKQPLQLAQTWSGAAGEYYERLFRPSNRAISIGRQKVVPLPRGMAPVLPKWSYDGSMIAFVETRPGALTGRIMVVRLDDLDNPWDISQEFSGAVRSFNEPAWTPDNRHVIFLVETGPTWENGKARQNFRLKIAPIDPTEGPVRDYNPPFTDIPLPLPLPIGKNISPDISKLMWGNALVVSNWGNLAYVSVQDDGQPIKGSPGVFLTDFNPQECFVLGGAFSPSGNMIDFTALENFDFSHTQAYILYDVEDILDGFALPPRSLEDPRVRPVAPIENTQFTGGFSFDESLALFNEDVNHAFNMMRPTNITACDFDIFYASALRDVSPKAVQIHLPGNQMFLTSSPEGNRIAYCNYTRTNFELRIVSFDIEAAMDMDLGGVLIDNSGTNLIVPPGTLEENFGVTISTPFTIGEEAEPTEGDNTFFAMRLLDATGLDNPQFNEPMTLTIRYTDDEVAGLDEGLLQVYYYDESHPQNPVWVPMGGTVDPDYNEITVEIQHFSKFAIGGRPLGDAAK